MRGTIKFFRRREGWGFITDSQTNKDYFVHKTSINKDIYDLAHKDDVVDFELGEGNNGEIQAVNVTPVITLSMILKELVKEGLHLMEIRDDKGVHGWYVVDAEEKTMIFDKEMSLLELAAYVGFNVEGLEEKENR